MANTRYNFQARLHSLAMHSGDLPAYITESGTYAPLSDYESWHWGNEIAKKQDLFNLTTQAPGTIFG